MTTPGDVMRIYRQNRRWLYYTKYRGKEGAMDDPIPEIAEVTGLPEEEIREL